MVRDCERDASPTRRAKRRLLIRLLPRGLVVVRSERRFGARPRSLSRLDLFCRVSREIRTQDSGVVQLPEAIVEPSNDFVVGSEPVHRKSSFQHFGLMRMPEPLLR